MAQGTSLLYALEQLDGAFDHPLGFSAWRSSGIRARRDGTVSACVSAATMSRSHLTYGNQVVRRRQGLAQRVLDVVASCPSRQTWARRAFLPG